MASPPAEPCRPIAIASVVSQRFVYELNAAFDFHLRALGHVFLGRGSARLNRPLKKSETANCAAG